MSNYELRFLAISSLYFSQVQEVSCYSFICYKTLSRYREGAGVGGGDPYEEVYSNAGVGSPISPDYRGPKVLSGNVTDPDPPDPHFFGPPGS